MTAELRSARARCARTRASARVVQHRMQQSADLVCARFARSISFGRS